VPLLVGHPTRLLGGKPQDSDGDRLSRKDPVRRGKMAGEVTIRDIARRRDEEFHSFDLLDGKAAKSLAQMAPGIEIPVIAIADEALGRDGAFGTPIMDTVAVRHCDPPALDQREHNGFEVLADTSACHSQDSDPP